MAGDNQMDPEELATLAELTPPTPEWSRHRGLADSLLTSWTRMQVQAVLTDAAATRTGPADAAVPSAAFMAVLPVKLTR